MEFCEEGLNKMHPTYSSGAYLLNHKASFQFLNLNNFFKEMSLNSGLSLINMCLCFSFVTYAGFLAMKEEIKETIQIKETII